jgi:hypothetical protein
MAKIWMPHDSTRSALVWFVVFGFLFQILVPVTLSVAGMKAAAWLAVYPRLLPIAWVTKGWFAGASAAGYVVMFTINTLVYSSLLFIGFRICGCVRREHA